jgi:sulfur transfer complex TusBCD TusB component (DsrH family)
MDKDTLIDQIADWLDTYVLAELIVDALEHNGHQPTLDNAKELWYIELEDLGARMAR